MKAKTSTTSKGQLPTRYAPIDPDTYPEEIETKEFKYFRLWCRPLYIVYEVYKNGTRVNFLIFPGSREVFQFNAMEKIVESITKGETLCKVF